MLITFESCAYKSLANLYDWYNRTLPEYLKNLGCADCLVNDDNKKECRISLEELINKRENLEVDWY